MSTEKKQKKADNLSLQGLLAARERIKAKAISPPLEKPDIISRSWRPRLFEFELTISPWAVQEVIRCRPHKLKWWQHLLPYNHLSFWPYSRVRFEKVTEPAFFQYGHRIVCHPTLEKSIRQELL